MKQIFDLWMGVSIFKTNFSFAQEMGSGQTKNIEDGIPTGPSPDPPLHPLPSPPSSVSDELSVQSSPRSTGSVDGGVENEGLEGGLNASKGEESLEEMSIGGNSIHTGECMLWLMIDGGGIGTERLEKGGLEGHRGVVTACSNLAR